MHQGHPALLPGSAAEQGALCLHGTEGLVTLLLCGVWDESWPEKKRIPSPKEKDEILNLRFVAFLQEIHLERPLSLPTGAWRRCPWASTASPAWDRGLRLVSYSGTSHPVTFLPTGGPGNPPVESFNKPILKNSF